MFLLKQAVSTLMIAALLSPLVTTPGWAGPRTSVSRAAGETSGSRGNSEQRSDEKLNPRYLCNSDFDPAWVSSGYESSDLTATLGAVKDPELVDLDTASAVQADCVASQICQPYQKPPEEYRFLHRFVVKTGEGFKNLILKTGHEFKQSLLAVQGKNLRARPIALADFIKNMAIIWPGQLYGAMLVNGDLHHFSTHALTQGISHLTATQLIIAMNTVFMVWTQSDRLAGATEEVAPLKSVELEGLSKTQKIIAVIKHAYQGTKGYKKEFKEKVVGGLTLIPVEITFLALLSTVAALLPDKPTVASPQYTEQVKNFATFALLFGTYLTFKWALVSKVLDLRGLPLLREWLSHRWNEKKIAAGVRKIETNNGIEKDLDEVSFFGLFTRDFLRVAQNKKFVCEMDETCHFENESRPDTQDRLSQPPEASASPDGTQVREQYRRRWNAYLRFRREEGITPSAAGLTHLASLPVEMTYRYGNSALDGLFAMWLVASGAPAIREFLASYF